MTATESAPVDTAPVDTLAVTTPTPGAAAGAKRSTWRRVLSAVTTVLVLVLLALALAVAVVPRLLGGAGLTVLTGSMEPTYSPGDAVAVAPKDDYQVGDVVAFQPFPDDPTLVTHRIVGLQADSDGTRFVTRGDANGADDEPIVAEQIVGSVRYHVPYVGHLANGAGDHRGTIVAIVAAGLIAYGAALVGSDLWGRTRRRAAGRGERVPDSAQDPVVAAAMREWAREEFI